MTDRSFGHGGISVGGFQQSETKPALADGAGQCTLALGSQSVTLTFTEYDIGSGETRISILANPTGLTLERGLAELGDVLGAGIGAHPDAMMPDGFKGLLSLEVTEIKLGFGGDIPWRFEIVFGPGRSTWRPPASLPHFLCTAAESATIALVLRELTVGGPVAATIILRDDIAVTRGDLNATIRATLGFPIAGDDSISINATLLPPNTQGRSGQTAPKIAQIINAIAASHVVEKGFADLEVVALEVSGAISPSAFSLKVELGGAWAIVEGLQLNELGMELSVYDGSMSGQLTAQLTLGTSHPVILSLEADFGGDAGLIFRGSLEAPQGTKDGKPAAITLSELVKDILQPFGKSPADLPKALDDFEVASLSMAFDVRSKNFQMAFDGFYRLAKDAQPLHATVRLQLAHTDGVFQALFDATLEVPLRDGSALSFSAAFDKQADGLTMLADFSDTEGVKITALEVLQAAGWSDAPDELASFSLTLHQAALGKVEKNFLLNLDIDGGIDLSSLSLPGLKLGGGRADPLKLSLQAVAAMVPAGGSLTAESLTALNALLPPGATPLPTPENLPLNASTVFLDTKITAGAFQHDVPLQISFGEMKAQRAAASSGDGAAANATPTSATPAPTPNATGVGGAPTSGATADTVSNNGVHWIPLQRSFGPVHLDRVGVAYVGGKVTAELSGALTAGPLTLSLIDLGVTSPIAKFEPSFSLDGLGLIYSAGPVEISGGLMRAKVGEATEYNGEAIIKTTGFSLTALGSFCDADDGPSLFIYGAFLEPLGGPVFCVVTGLAAGFGLHRRLVMPTIDRVSTFPLVAIAMGTDPAPALTQVLSELANDVPIAPGENFGCIGIRFTSFKIIDSFLLLAVQFGRHLEIDLLGVSTLTMPPAPHPPDLPLLASAELDIEGKFIPDEGHLEVRGQLKPSSYVYSPLCHVTGGFALASWFHDLPAEGARAGDFVLTLGGYHPHYSVPSHYPQNVPRLCFNYQLSSKIRMGGGLYFAIAPNCAMAGGELHANFDSGSVHAWFTLCADFLIFFKPFHYDIDLYVSIGAQVTIHFFGTHHLSFDAGADVHVWGPPMTGEAHIHLKVCGFKVHFDVGFGGGGALPTPIDWAHFSESFLHVPPNKPKSISTVSIEKGLLRMVPNGDGPKRWIVNARDLSFSVASTIPSRSVQCNSGTQRLSAHQIFAVRPMGFAGKEIGPGLTLSITDENGETVPVRWSDEAESGPAGATIVARVITKSMPAALWGVPELTSDGHLVPPDVNEKHALLADCLSGIAVSASPPRTTATHAIPRRNLAFSTDLASPGGVPTPMPWECVPAFVPDPQEDWADSKAKWADATRILRDGTTRNRQKQVLEELGLAEALWYQGADCSDGWLSPPQISA